MFYQYNDQGMYIGVSAFETVNSTDQRPPSKNAKFVAGRWMEFTRSKISIPTLIWLRDHLGGEAELAIREYAAGASSASSNTLKRTIYALMTAVDARVNDAMIVSDPDYRLYCKALRQAELIDDDKLAALLTLGGHDPEQ